jgi:outer membrane protein assembly factor BamB
MNTKQLVAVMVLLGVPAVAHANDWVEIGANNTGAHDSSESSGSAFAPAWTYAMPSGGAIIATPVSVGGMVVIGGTKGDISVVGLEDGKESWTRMLDGGVGATATVSAGRVLVPTFGGQLYSLHLATGETDWQVPFGGVMNYSSPVLLADGSGTRGTMVLPEGFPCQDVTRVDIGTGALSWKTAPGAIADLVYSSAAIGGGQAIIGVNGGRYQSLDLQTGATRWIYDAAGQGGLSSALIDGDRVYMFPGDADSQLYAVDVATGAPVAGFPLSIPDPSPVAGQQMYGRGPAVSSPMKIGNLVVVQLRRQTMVANGDGSSTVTMREYVVGIDPEAAQIVWQQALATQIVLTGNGVPELDMCATPAGFAGGNGGLLAVSSSISPVVAVLDAATGNELWSASLSGPGRSSPVFSNGQLLVGTDAGILHAFSSTSNRPPSAPTLLTPAAVATDGAMATGATVAWQGASDPENDVLSYRLRVVEQDHPETLAETDTASGQTSVSLSLKANTTYNVAIRSNDAHGALSAWSTVQQISVGAAPPLASPDPTPAVTDPAPATTATSSYDEANAGGCSFAGAGRNPGPSALVAVTFGLALALRGSRRRQPSRRGDLPISF